MRNLRLVVRRLIICTVLGAAFLPMTRLFDALTSRYDVNPREMLYGAVIGALYALFAGIAWVIEHKPARRRFILGLAVGYLFGIAFTFAVATGSRLPVVLGPAAGALVGGVLAFSKIRDVRNT